MTNHTEEGKFHFYKMQKLLHFADFHYFCLITHSCAFGGFPQRTNPNLSTISGLRYAAISFGVLIKTIIARHPQGDLRNPQRSELRMSLSVSNSNDLLDNFNCDESLALTVLHDLNTVQSHIYVNYEQKRHLTINCTNCTTIQRWWYR